MGFGIVVPAVASQAHLGNKLGSLSVQRHARDELTVLIVYIKLRIATDGDGHLKESRAVSQNLGPGQACVKRFEYAIGWITIDIPERGVGRVSVAGIKHNGGPHPGNDERPVRAAIART